MADAAAQARAIEVRLRKAELDRMLSGPADGANAIVSIHPGAGGTDAKDWAMMLFRMYVRWCERRGSKTEILDYQEGEVDDGLDNNGNGLADEGVLLWTRDLGGAGESTHVICRGVREYLQGEEPNLDADTDNGLEDEPGYCLERVGETLVIRLTLERQVSDAGIQQRTIETSVKLRSGSRT